MLPSLDPARTLMLGDQSTDAGRAALMEIFRAYFDTVSAGCAAMRQATSLEVVKAHAHRAKGASGVVGAVALTARFAEIEANAAAGELIPAALFDDVDRELEMLRQVVAARIGEERQ